jgi:hypothetical protein
MITGELLERVAAQVSGNFGNISVMSDTAALTASLRQQFPNVHFTVCSDDDMPPNLKPAFASTLVRLYYVDANEHCLKLTTDAEAASGIVVAFHDDA